MAIAKSVITLFWIFFYWLKSIGLYFVPIKYRRKNIASDIVLITGAGNGLGRQLALKLAPLASEIVLWDLDESGLKETARLIQRTGTRCFTYTCDVTNREQVYRTAERVKNDIGHVSILINNAGIVNGKKLLDLPDELIVKTYEVNSLSHFWICKALLPNMMDNNHGHVVTISSIVGNTGCPYLTDYAASKFAAVGFHESICLETWAEGFTGINFTLVCPSHMSTGMFDGAKYIIPPLSPEYMADRTIDAILTNQCILVEPKLFYYIATLKTLLPVMSMYYIMVALDGLSAMKNFVGHGNNNKRKKT